MLAEERMFVPIWYASLCNTKLSRSAIILGIPLFNNRVENCIFVPHLISYILLLLKLWSAGLTGEIVGNAYQTRDLYTYSTAIVISGMIFELF